jgi:hypothetical protein
MKKQFITVVALALLALGSSSCKKTYDDQHINPVGDRLADIPVIVTNYTYFERFPIITTSIAGGGQFSINFEIPADKGTIKEITKVTSAPTAAATSLANLNAIVGMSGATTALAYNAKGTGANRVVNPIPGNNTNKITFTSNLSEYLAFRQANGSVVGPATTTTTPVSLPAPSTSQTPTEIQFYFLITLTDGTTIIPQPVRIRVLA